MSKKKILTIVGARPQFVKAAMISRSFQKIPSIQEVILHTGQHFDSNMSDLFFTELSIPTPYKNLNIVGAGLHGDHTARMLTAVEKEIIDIKPDAVMLYGDTNSTLAGALAAAKLHVPVAHVEAGMRSFNRKMPEEINRVISDHLSSILFCSTQESVTNLHNENIKNHVYHVGDVMIDAIYLFQEMARKKKVSGDLPKDYYLLTLHRQESTDKEETLQEIFSALSKTSVQIIFPAHPRTKNLIQKYGIKLSNMIHITEPVGYLDMIQLISQARAVFTDSGGLQKEAIVLGKKCFTLREETEWTETVKEGWNKILGRDYANIVNALKVAADPISSMKPFPTEKYYGDGKAAEKIVQHFADFLN